ncbi:MAG: type IV pilus modification protein PilV [Deltaproteobacteria bacterium]|nr:type IV pilus modification protein PilV [Deltaproteobacteria bacterium]
MLNQKGFTLLEVLIAIVILSIGLLGVAAMQTTAILGNTSAMNRSRAIGLAEEMADRVRVNAGSTPNIYDAIDTSGVCGGSEPALGDCTQWQARLQASALPNAFGTVAVTMDSPIPKAATITITVTWGIGATGSATITTIMETWLT